MNNVGRSNFQDLGAQRLCAKLSWSKRKIEVCENRKVENASSTICVQYRGTYLKIDSRNFPWKLLTKNKSN